MFLLRFILYGTLCASWTFSFSLLGKFPITISSTFFWYSFFFPSCSGTPIIRMLVHLIWFQRSLRLSDWTELSVLLSYLLHPWVWDISSQPLQCLPSYWGFFDLLLRVSVHACSCKAQPLKLTLDVGNLFMATPEKCNHHSWLGPGVSLHGCSPLQCCIATTCCSSKKQRRKGKIYPFEFRAAKRSKER